LEGNYENQVSLEFVLVDIRIKSDIRKCIEFGVPECDREASKTRRPWPTKGCCSMGKKLGIVSCPPEPVPLIGPGPSSFRLAQTSFVPNLYPYKYSSDLFPVTLVRMTYEDGTVCSERFFT
jgi:hypothetical protein